MISFADLCFTTYFSLLVVHSGITIVYNILSCYPCTPGSCLKCWVGHHSITVSQMQLVDCDQASEVTADRTSSPVTTLSLPGEHPGAGAQLRGLGGRGGGLHQGVGLQQAAAPGHRHQGLRADGEPARVVGPCSAPHDGCDGGAGGTDSVTAASATAATLTGATRPATYRLLESWWWPLHLLYCTMPSD